MNKLTKIVLIDSLVEGQYTELCTGNGMVITGINGKGKSSYLQLVPLFLGEEPSNITTQNVGNGRDTFYDYYFPNQTSYIVFEYTKDNEPRCVAVHAGRKQGLSYRFIRSSFDIKLFSGGESSADLVTFDALTTRLDELGIAYASKQIDSITDYRSIIQKTTNLKLDNKHQQYLNLVQADYSFGKIAYAEKVVTSLFKGETDFKSLQKIISRSLESDKETLSVEIDPSKIKSWLTDFEAYQSLMKKVPVLNKISEHEKEVTVLKTSLSGVKSKLMCLMNYSERQLEEKITEIKAIKKSLDQLKIENEFAIDKLKENIFDLTLEVKENSKNLSKLEKEKEEFDTLEIQSKKNEISGMYLLEQERDSLASIISALTKNASNIENEFEKAKNNRQKAYQQSKDDNEQKVNDLRAKNSISKKNARAEYDNEVEALKNVYAEKIALLDGDLSVALVEIGEANANIKNLSPSRESIAQINSKQSEKDKQVAVFFAQNKDITAKKEQLSLIKNEFNDFEKKKAVLTALIAEKEKGITELELSISLEEKSLLNYLRLNTSESIDKILKVIDKDLLSRTDLSPEFIEIESSNSIFGLKINTENIEEYQGLNIEYLKESLIDAKNEFEQLNLKNIELNNSLGLVSGKKKLKESELLTIETEHGILERKLSSFDKELNKMKNDQKSEIESNKEKAEYVLQVLLKKKTAIESEIKNQKRKLEHEFLIKKSDFDNASAKIDTEEFSYISLLQLQNKKAQEEKDLAFSAIDAACNFALQNEGVDTVNLNQKKSSLESVVHKIKTISSYVKEVEKWDSWIENEWLKYEELKIRSRDLNSKLEDLNKEKEVNLASFQTSKVTIQSKVDDLSKQEAKFSETIQKTRNILPELQDYPFDEEYVYDNSFSLNLLLQEIRDIKNRLNLQLSAIIVALKEIQSEFTFNKNKGANFNLITDDLFSLDEECYASWLAKFKEWFAEHSINMKQSIQREITTILGGVTHFGREVELFSKKVREFNRDMQVQLNSSMHFHSLSELTISISSTTENIAGWDYIKKASYEKVNNFNSTELPGEELVEAIKELSLIWSNNHTRTAINLDDIIVISGGLVENGNKKTFKRSSDFKDISSNGISYLIVIIILLAFLKKIKKDQEVEIPVAIDELKTLDSQNIDGLVRLAKQYGFSISTALPEGTGKIMELFKNVYKLNEDYVPARQCLIIDNKETGGKEYV